MTREQEAITYFEGQKKRLEDFRKVYPSPNTVGYQATTKEISFYAMAISALSENKTRMIDKSNFDTEQYKADLQCAYDCGKALYKADLIKFYMGIGMTEEEATHIVNVMETELDEDEEESEE